MVTLRCTRRLLDRLGADPPVEPLAPTTRLGDWYANLLFMPGRQVVLAVSERTLLPVVVPAAPASTLVARFRAAVREALVRLEIPAAAVERECREMENVRVGRTASRTVLGSMRDFAIMLEYRFRNTASLADAATELATAPCGPLGMKCPEGATAELFPERRASDRSGA